jgi:sulfite reductase (NADPH) flavoprotein alpha-component
MNNIIERDKFTNSKREFFKAKIVSSSYPIKETKKYKKINQIGNVQHICFDISNKNIRYSPGDLVEIFPENKLSYLKLFLYFFNLRKKEKIYISHIKTHESIYTALKNFFCLTTITDELKIFLNKTPDYKIKKMIKIEEKKEDLPKIKNPIITFIKKTLIKKYFYKKKPYFYFSINPNKLFFLLKKNISRLYSITSSQNKFPNQIHILIKFILYRFNKKKVIGLCSSFLLKKIESFFKKKKSDVLMSIRKSNFSYSNYKESMIMIGVGTGIAPFRSFLLEKIERKNEKNNWLIFGGKKKENLYYYHDFKKLKKLGVIKNINFVLSRKLKKKYYVQDKFLKDGKHVWNWITKYNSGIFVCGHIKMALSIREAMLKIIQKYKGLSKSKSLDFFTKIKQNMQYNEEIY